MPTLESIQIGQPQQLPADRSHALFSKPWRTAIFKNPVTGSVVAGPTGIQGDGQADLKDHGGVDKAVCVYPVSHFEYWQKFLERDDFGVGGFGENLSVMGLVEADVAIGDRWKIGTATFEVSQPRQPCWKLARRWQAKKLTAEAIATGKTGWYLRTIEPGTICSGDEIFVLPADGGDQGRCSIEDANHVFYRKKEDRDAAARLIGIPALSEAWRSELQKRLT